jgi:hypothetical protein
LSYYQNNVCFLQQNEKFVVFLQQQAYLYC